MRTHGNVRLGLASAGLMLVLLATVLVGAAPAHALNTATFTAASPAANATVLVKPSSAQIVADDTAMITGATVTINGYPATFVNRDYFVGHSAFDEESESDYWAVDDWTVTRVIGYLPVNRIVLGSNIVVTTVTSANGISTNTRTFFYGSVTTITGVAPSSGAVLGSSPTSITATWSSASAAVSSSMKLDGVTVPTTFSALTRTFTYTVPSAMTPGVHTVVFTARDVVGTTVTRTWSFTVSPPMSNDWDCTACHSTYLADHPVSGCEACHDHGYPENPGEHSDPVPTAAGCTGNQWSDCHHFDHGGGADWDGSGPFACATCHSTSYPAVPRHDSADTEAVHTSSTNVAACGIACHSGSLITEHGKYPSAATVKYQCDICHGPAARQQVKDAIAAGNTGCEDCHTDFAHGDHASNVSSTPLGTTGTVCGDCHLTDLGDEHAKPTSSSVFTGCATCHPVPRNSFVTWNKTCAQGGCHVAGSATQMHGGTTVAHTAPAPSCTVEGCHAGGTDISAIHATQGCLTCHGGDKVPTADCSECHDTEEPHGDLAPTHLATMTFSDMVISGDDFGTHACSECHASSGLLTIHGSTDADCMKCHPTPKSTLTPAWDKSCTQGGCHTGSTETMHVTIDADHQPDVADATCVASGCHASTSIAALHENAVGPIGGEDRASCQICHYAGTPTKSCVTCHPDRTEAHGYLADRHLGTPTAAQITIGSVDYPAIACTNCHDAELGPEHLKPTSTSSADGCSACHPTPRDTLTPWVKTTCAQGDCHAGASEAIMHAEATVDHARLSANASCFVSGCHTDADLAAIHASATDASHSPARTSCMVCHAEGVPVTADCTNASCHADKVDPHYAAEDHLAAPSDSVIEVGGATYGPFACNTCHATDLGTEHSASTSSSSAGGCAVCHAAAVGSLGGAWDKSCAQVDCHTVTSDAPTHENIDAAHVHAVGNDSCFAAGCHSNQDLAAIHSLASTTVAGDTRTSCEICHSEGVPTNKDCTASGCHVVTDPPHDDGATQDAHTSTTTGCGPCHDTALPTEHAKYPTGSPDKYTCVDCHGPAARQQVKDAIAAGDTACIACHVAPEDVPAHSDMAESCTTCHTTYPAAHPISGCEDCHDHGYPENPGTHSDPIPTVAGCMGNEWSDCHHFDHGGGADWDGSGPFTCAQCHNTSFPNVPQHWTP